MYKVFVDHKPVIFIEEKDSVDGNQSIMAESITSFRRDVRKMLKVATLDQPLQVICTDPSRSFEEVFADHLKINAAGGLVKRKDRFLLIKRKGLWDIPKGKMTKREKPAEAALREVSEECGINGQEIIQTLCTTYHTMKVKKRWALKRTYWYTMSYNGPKMTVPQLNEGITKVKWMSEEHMLSIRGRTYGSINDVLDHYVQKH